MSPKQKRPRKSSERKQGRTPHSRGRRPKSDQHCVVGRRFVMEAIRGGTVTEIFIADALREKVPEIVSLAAEKTVSLSFEPPQRLDARSDGAKHQGVVALGPPFPYVSLETFLSLESPLLIALDEVQDPHNLGAILRSALAFGANGAIVPMHRSAAVTPTVVRASAGASERIPIARVTNLQRSLQDLGQAGMDVVGLSADGEVSVDALGSAPSGRVLVVGSEGAGLRRLVRQRCTRTASIPQLTSFDSLNASVAAALALYEASRCR